MWVLHVLYLEFMLLYCPPTYTSITNTRVRVKVRVYGFELRIRVRV